MKLHEHERAGPHIAGLASAVQQAEIRLLLDGRWPPLKPLPVFKFETDECRGAIDFDKLRGEWVCRKTLPSNKVQELRGALAEIIMALPRDEAEVLGELTAAEQPEEELDKEATRRREAVLAWQENHESGALYVGLRDYLSESQREEIGDIIRLTLTARQLQVNPKNVAYVFDALAKAGGKLATLIEIARQNKAEQEAGVPAKAKSAAAGVSASSDAVGSSGGRGFVSVEANHSTLDAGVKGLTPAVFESAIPVSIESVPQRPMESVFLMQEERSSPETAQAASPAWKTLTPEIVDTTPPRSLAEELRERGRQYAAFRRLRAGLGNGLGTGLGVSLNTGFLPQGRTEKVATSADRGENSSARSRVLEISGWQVAAAALLVALSTLAVVFAVGRGMMGERHPDSRKVMPTVAATSSAPLRDPSDPTSRNSTPPMDRTSPIPELNPPAPAAVAPSAQIPVAQHLSARPEESATRAEPVGPLAASPAIATRASTRILADSHNSEASAGGKDANEVIARNVAPPAITQPGRSPAASAIGGVPVDPAPRWEAPAPHIATHLSSPSTMLVSGPGDGSKPFRLTLPEKPIAASSVFAMTSQLSVLVPPEPGFGPARKPARLQTGELISFVWPRYPKPGERHGSAETVKVRTTIGEFGQVLDVKRVSGSTALLPAAVSAIRQWRYKPTLLNRRPVQTQEDVTIEFRPAQRVPRGGSWRAARE